ncbi:MAG: hypothetical protein ACJAQ2_001246 [Vicingaceae bacterium]
MRIEKVLEVINEAIIDNYYGHLETDEATEDKTLMEVGIIEAKIWIMDFF